MRRVLLLLLLLAGCAERAEPNHLSRPAELTDDSLIASDGTRLKLQSWLPAGSPKAVIIALHGFNDYSNAFALPAPSLAAAGFALYAYDQRGFGESNDAGRWAGLARMQSDLYQAIQLLAMRHPGKRLFILGESMGGAVAMTALSHPTIDQVALPSLSGLILVAPAVWSRAVMPWYQDGALWLSAHLIPWVTVTGRGLGVKSSDNIEMLRAMSRNPLVIKATRIDTIKGLCDLMDEASLAAPRLDIPTLVLIAGQDQVIPEEASRAMLARGGTSLQTRFYPDAYHMMLRDLHPEQRLADIAAWIEATP